MHDIIKPRRDAEKLSTPNGWLRVGKVEKVSKYHGLANQQKTQSATVIIIIHSAIYLIRQAAQARPLN